MRFLYAALLFAGLLPGVSWGQCQGQTTQLVALAHESITVAGTALPLTAATYAQSGGTAAYALVTVEDAPVRYEIDGGTPSSTVGHLANPGASVSLCGIDLVSKFKAIRSTATSATVKVTYLKARP